MTSNHILRQSGKRIFFGLALLLVFIFFGFTPFGSLPDQQKVEDMVIKTDSSEFVLSKVTDSTGQLLFFYRDVDQFPCNDSVCERMQIRLYWDIFGNYLKFSFPQGGGLTKLNHKKFSAKEYLQLHLLLNNPKSDLKFYKLEDLTDKDSERRYYSTDAVTGATLSAVSYETVRGAVKTCYSLWKIVNGETAATIRKRTMDALSVNSIAKQGDSLSGTNLFITLDNLKHNKSADVHLTDQLQSLLQKGQTPEATAVYNYFLQQKDNSKPIRSYIPLFVGFD